MGLFFFQSQKFIHEYSIRNPRLKTINQNYWYLYWCIGISLTYFCQPFLFLVLTFRCNLEKVVFNVLFLEVFHQGINHLISLSLLIASSYGRLNFKSLLHNNQLKGGTGLDEKDESLIDLLLTTVLFQSIKNYESRLIV